MHDMSSPLPRTDLSYQQVWRQDEAVETLWHSPDNEFLASVAPHGGDIESCTDEAAVELLKKCLLGGAQRGHSTDSGMMPSMNPA